MRFKFLPLGWWRYLVLILASACLGLAALSLWDGCGGGLLLIALAVISSTGNVVQLNLKEPQPRGFVTFRLSKAKKIRLGLEDTQAFLEAVRA